MMESEAFGQLKSLRQFAVLIDAQTIVKAGVPSNIAAYFIYQLQETLSYLDEHKVTGPRLQLLLQLTDGPQQGQTVQIRSSCNLLFGN